jgi:hypothetical protein
MPSSTLCVVFDDVSLKWKRTRSVPDFIPTEDRGNEVQAAVVISEKCQKMRGIEPPRRQESPRRRREEKG